MRANKGCVPKLGLSLLALYSKFHFSLEECFFGLGWVGGLAGGGGSARSTPPPPRASEQPDELVAELREQ